MHRLQSSSVLLACVPEVGVEGAQGALPSCRCCGYGTAGFHCLAPTSRAKRAGTYHGFLKFLIINAALSTPIDRWTLRCALRALSLTRRSYQPSCSCPIPSYTRLNYAVSQLYVAPQIAGCFYIIHTWQHMLAIAPKPPSLWAQAPFPSLAVLRRSHQHARHPKIFRGRLGSCRQRARTYQSHIFLRIIAWHRSLR